MKKSLLALAVLSAFAGAASAQSSVTLSGGIDAAIQRTEFESYWASIDVHQQLIFSFNIFCCGDYIKSTA